MRTATVLQTVGVILAGVAWVAVFGWWAVASAAGLMLVLAGVGLERRAVDGPQRRTG